MAEKPRLEKKNVDMEQLVEKMVEVPQIEKKNVEVPQIVALDAASAEYRRVEKLALEQQHKGNAYVKGKLKVTGVSRVQAPSPVPF